jgi:hypothetical protein
VKGYDASLELIPGLPLDGGDGIGRDAAYNRGIALARIEDEKKDAGPDSPPDAAPDSGSPDSGPPDGGQDPDAGKPDKSQKDSQKDGGPPDAGQQNEPQEHDGGPPDAGKQPEPREQPKQPPQSQDDRMLDMLERAPSVQQQDAKNRSLTGRSRTEDK